MATLELQHISKSFDGLKAIDDLSIRFERGSVTSLIGPNGAGKTTLLNLVSGLISPDSGKILYNNQKLNGLAPWQRADRGFGRLWQDVRIFQNLTVLDNILLARKNHPGELIFKNIYQLNCIKQFEKENIEHANRWLEFVGLNKKQQTLARDLSYGQQKMLAFARLLNNDANVLLLDEPTSGVHPRFVEKIIDLIRNIAKNGKTIIIIEHNFNVVAQISHTICLMIKGRIELQDNPNKVAQSLLLKEVYLGI
ncbi:MAG: ATP-binding cassette domain-containing protein [Deferribacteres bacterium]|nr:ATP-binding cassette domain-containing protein [Deferribacteres bacterium]